MGASHQSGCGPVVHQQLVLAGMVAALLLDTLAERVGLDLHAPRGAGLPLPSGHGAHQLEDGIHGLCGVERDVLMLLIHALGGEAVMQGADRRFVPGDCELVFALHIGRCSRVAVLVGPGRHQGYQAVGLGDAALDFGVDGPATQVLAIDNAQIERVDDYPRVAFQVAGDGREIGVGVIGVGKEDALHCVVPGIPLLSCPL